VKGKASIIQKREKKKENNDLNKMILNQKKNLFFTQHGISVINLRVKKGIVLDFLLNSVSISIYKSYNQK